MNVALMILAGAAGMLVAAANAETRTLQLWTCTVNSGKTLADVQAVGSKWVKLINAKGKGGDILGADVTPITGNGDLYSSNEN